MKRLLRLLFCTLFLLHGSAFADTLRIAGSPTVNIVLGEAAQILRSEQGLDVQMSTTGGSTAGIAAVGEGSAQIAMASRPVTPDDRTQHPDVALTEFYLGEQVVALGVAKDVWESGVRALTRDQMRGIYESKVRNWKEVGGPDESILFFNIDEGRGIWEIFAQWLYDDARKAPLVKFTRVPTVAEARDMLEFRAGALAQVAPLAVDGEHSYALGVKIETGEVIAPTLANVVQKKYPMTRPLILVINDKPTGPVKMMVDFMLGPRGQELMKKSGFFSADMLKAAGGK